MQSGGAKGEKWRIDFDTLSSGGRWENPLMGWASSSVTPPRTSCNVLIRMFSADYMQGTRLAFNSQDDAIHFAEKQGVSCFLFAKYPKALNYIDRLGLLCTTFHCQADTAQELRRELRVQATQASYRPHQIDSVVRILYLRTHQAVCVVPPRLRLAAL